MDGAAADVTIFPQTRLLPLPLAVAAIGLSGIAYYWVNQWIKRHINRCEEERLKLRRSAWEAAVGYILETLPDDYVIFSDWRSLSGNTDHSTVGPTGIFVIDTMNWRGICAGQPGELFVRRPPDRTLRGEIPARADRIAAGKNVSSRRDFIRASSPSRLRVDAPWGTTRNAQSYGRREDSRSHPQMRFSRPMKKNEIALIEP